MTRKKRMKVSGDRMLLPPADDTAKKTRLSFTRSKAPGEFLQVTIMRTAPDEHARWALHFALDQTVSIVLSLAFMLPARELLIVVGQLLKHPDVVAYVAEREAKEAAEGAE